MLDVTGDPHHPSLRSLVDLAVASDDAARLIVVAGEFGHALGLVDDRGRPLACVPGDDAGQRALAVAKAAARTSVAPPPGWQISEIVHRSARLGFLAVGTGGPSDAETESVVSALPTLLADQLRRAGLVRLHRAAFVGRLVSDPPLAPHPARREAAELGLRLADAYWPAVLMWRSGTTAELLESAEREAQRLGEGSLTALLNGRLVLLYPEHHPGRGGAAWFERVARRARELAPASRPQVIAGETAVELGRLSAAVASLTDFGRFGERFHRDRLVTWAYEYALYSLLSETVPPDAAASFVHEQLGELLDWDHDHRTDLAGVLEAALDFPRHDEAARRCFMHRNTFRHHLHRASEVLGGRLENPDTRLGIHVALKLRHVLARPSGTGSEPPADTGGRKVNGPAGP
jgi:hypothetical protein